MRENFMDIVAVIVRQMAEDEGAGPRDKSIIEGLLSEGYDLLDIDDALSWFESLGGNSEDVSGIEFWPGFKGVRVQARWEKEVMTPEAYAYLMRLNGAGFVEDAFRESILEKIEDLSINDFDVHQMRALLGLVLYSQGKLMPDLSNNRFESAGPGGLLN